MAQKEQKKRRFGILYILLICVLAIAIALYVRSTMSQYTSAGEGTGTADVAVWNVTFKGDADSTYSDTMNMTFAPDKSEQVVEGKIAPGLSATGKGYIDLTGTETAVNFTVSVNQSDLDTALSAAGVSGAEADALDLTVSSITASNNSIDSQVIDNHDGTFTIDLPNGSAMTADEEVTVVVTLTWNDDTNGGVSDTKIGTKITQIELPVTVTVTQVTPLVK